MPERIRLRRTAGWRKPAGTVVVARPGRFGNPFRVGDTAPDGTAISTRDSAVRLFADWITTSPADVTVHHDRHADIRAHLSELRGHDLACWCPLDGPCHADVLLTLANE